MASRFFQCKNSPDNFCYICGSYVLPHLKRTITSEIKRFFSKYFDCPVGDQDKTWAPHIVCSKCNITLKEWEKSKGKTQFPFVTPMYWMEVTDHEKCYFCQIDLKGMNRNKRRSLVYPDVKSAKKPRLFKDGEARPQPDCSSSDSSPKDQIDSANCSFADSNAPKLFTQQQLNDLVRNLDLSKQKAAVLGQTLYDLNLLGPDCIFTYFRDRHQDYAKYFEEEDSVTFCKDIK